MLGSRFEVRGSRFEVHGSALRVQGSGTPNLELRTSNRTVNPEHEPGTQNNEA
jgi:hypothetical protein